MQPRVNTMMGLALRAACLAAIAPPLGLAQAAPRTATVASHGIISGTVTDTGLRVIAGAHVSVIGTGSELLADDNGRFAILQVPPGEFLVWVRKLGYRPISNLVHVEQGDTLRLAFTLEPTMTDLAPVVVTERVRSPRMREFDERRRAGFGDFLDQAQIEKMNFVQVEAVIRTFKAVRVTPAGGAVSAREPPGVAACPMQVFLDGIPRGSMLGDLPSPREIAAIEVYAGPATTPVWVPKYERAGLVGKPSCGVILIWTRDGG